MTRQLKKVFLLNIFILIIAASHVFFYIPPKITSGGFMSIALILYHSLNLEMYSAGMSVAIIALALNIPLLVYSFFAFGKEYVMKTVYGTLMLPVFAYLIDAFLVSMKWNISTLPLWLATAVGSILAGIGTGAIMVLGGSSGGIDILGKVLHKYVPAISIGSGVTISSVLIIIASAFIFGPTNAFFSVIAAVIMGISIDWILSNFKRKV